MSSAAPSHSTVSSATRDQARTLEEDLAELSRLAEAGPVTFGACVDALQERAGISLLVILSFAFMLVPIPGVSTVSSVLFVALAISAVLGTKLYLPQWVRKRSMSQASAKKVVDVATKGWKKVGKLVKPRLSFLTYGPFRWLAGLSLTTAIVAFALPIPIPFNNAPPSFCILLLALGLLGRDGIMVILGHLANAILWVVLFFAGDFLWDMLRKVMEKIS